MPPQAKYGVLSSRVLFPVDCLPVCRLTLRVSGLEVSIISRYLYYGTKSFLEEDFSARFCKVMSFAHSSNG